VLDLTHIFTELYTYFNVQTFLKDARLAWLVMLSPVSSFNNLNHMTFQ